MKPFGQLIVVLERPCGIMYLMIDENGLARSLSETSNVICSIFRQILG
jgi:hypothetical protein